jgi:hypothetical protein
MDISYRKSWKLFIGGDMKRHVLILLVLSFLLCMLQAVCFGESRTVYGEIWGYRIYREEAKAGLMQGDETVIAADYDDIIPFGVFNNETCWSEQKAFYTVQGWKKGALLLHDDSVLTIPAIYDDIDYMPYDKTWIVKQDQLYGAYDQNASLAVPVICRKKPRVFDSVCILSAKSPCAYYSIPDGVTYYPDYDEIYGFFEGLCLVKSGNLYGYINRQNECVIPCRYERAYSFNAPGIAWVTDGNDPYNLYYTIDKEGNILFRTDGYACEFNDYGVSLILDYESGRYGLINTKGEYLSEKDAWDMESAEFDGNGCFIATIDGEKWGIADSNGKTVVPFLCEPDYRYMLRFHENTVVFCENEADSLYSIYGLNGEKTGSFHCYASPVPEHFSDGLLLIASSEGETCYIDRTGTIVIPSSPELSYVSDFSEGLATVISDNGYGYIGTDGQIAIETKYESASGFYNQFAVVTEGGKEKYINHNGEVIYEEP